MKIVIDTNLVASGIYFGGKPQKLLQSAIKGDFEVFVSKEITDEYKEIVDRLSQKYPSKFEKLPLDLFVESCMTVVPKRKIAVCRDSDDNKFLECALESKSLYVVSGDDDFPRPLDINNRMPQNSQFAIRNSQFAIRNSLSTNLARNFFVGYTHFKSKHTQRPQECGILTLENSP